MEYFGYALRRLARTTDIVNDMVIDQVRTYVQEYLDRALDVKNVDIMRKTRVDQAPALGQLGPGGNVLHAFLIWDENGVYTCHVAHTYGHAHPAWVVAPDGSSLGQAGGYVDLWSGATDLPAYWSPTETLDAKTCIILPLNHRGERIGAVCMESVRSLEITEAAKEELNLIAEALAILLLTYDAAIYAEASKQEAIRELRDIIPKDPDLTLPHVFVVYPGNGPSDVVNAILAALNRDEFHRTLTYEQWKADPGGGPVSGGMVDFFANARLGICYLSEPDDEEADTQYRDNDNVLVEAGMFEALSAIGYSAGWVPVREGNAPDPPFDLSSLRFVIVPRNNDGSLNQPEFEEELCTFIRRLIE